MNEDRPVRLLLVTMTKVASPAAATSVAPGSDERNRLMRDLLLTRYNGVYSRTISRAEHVIHLDHGESWRAASTRPSRRPPPPTRPLCQGAAGVSAAVYGVQQVNSTGQDPHFRQPMLGPRTAAVFSAALVLAAASPVVENFRDIPRDGFPLSYYPMFSARRGETYIVQHLFGLDAAGRRSYISFARIGSGGHNQVRRQLQRIVREGRADDLCPRVAERIASRPEYAHVERLVVVSAHYHIDAWFAGDRNPVHEEIHGRCRVKRAQP